MRVSGGVGQPSKRMHVCMLSRFSRVRLCDPMGCTHQAALSMGILQARILEQAAVPSSRGEYVSEGGKAYAEEEKGREAGVGGATSIFWWS